MEEFIFLYLQAYYVEVTIDGDDFGVQKPMKCVLKIARNLDHDT